MKATLTEIEAAAVCILKCLKEQACLAQQLFFFVRF